MHSRISFCFNSDSHRPPPLHCKRLSQRLKHSRLHLCLLGPAQHPYGGVNTLPRNTMVPRGKKNTKQEEKKTEHFPLQTFHLTSLAQLYLEFSRRSSPSSSVLIPAQTHADISEARRLCSGSRRHSVISVNSPPALFFSPPVLRELSAYTRDTKCPPKTLKLLSGRSVMQMTTLFQTSITFLSFPP